MSRRFSPSCAESSSGGYSIIEVLVSMTIALSLIAGALTLALCSRRMYQTEQVRTRLGQSLRAAREVLVTDVRQTGERLGGNFPAIVLTRGEDLPGGSPGDADELVLRRNLLPIVLLVCEDVSPTDSEVVVAIKSSPPPGCAPLPIDPGDTYPTNLQDWSDQRLAGGGTTSAYIFDPVTGSGEFFTFESEGEDLDGFFIRKPVGSPDWQIPYLTSQGSQIYLLEERRYRLSGGVLQMLLAGDTTDPVNLVDSIDDFQVRVFPKPTSTVPNPAPLESFTGTGWRTLRSVELSVSGSADLSGRTIQRGWVTEILPRNVL